MTSIETPTDVHRDMRYQPVTCPNCGRADARHRYQLTVSAIVTCHECQLSYVNPRVASSELNRKLQAWAEQDVVDDERLRETFEPATLDYYRRLLSRLAVQARRNGRRLLDVGCSTGAFLTLAREHGWQAEGLELGIASARYAREQLGLQIHQGSIFDFDAAAGSFDALAMIEVIEHLERPRDALMIAHRLLAPDGVLLVTTPNFDSLYRRLFGARWWVINCEDEHIVLFNLESLSRMLEQVGFEVMTRHIRGIDWLGLYREWRSRRSGRPAAANTAVDGYYDSRSSKRRIKNLLARLGVLAAARGVMRALDRSFTWRYSPTFAWGEQIIMVARRRDTDG